MIDNNILEHAKLHCMWCVCQDNFILHSVILILNLLGQPFLIPHNCIIYMTHSQKVRSGDARVFATKVLTVSIKNIFFICRGVEWGVREAGWKHL